jgi:hypothetical protein
VHLPRLPIPVMAPKRSASTSPEPSSQLDIGPWRDVAALPTVRLETCFARRRRGQRGHAARGEARRAAGAAGARTRVHARGHLGHLSLPFPAHLSVPYCSL